MAARLSGCDVEDLAQEAQGLRLGSAPPVAPARGRARSADLRSFGSSSIARASGARSDSANRPRRCSRRASRRLDGTFSGASRRRLRSRTVAADSRSPRRIWARPRSAQAAGSAGTMLRRPGQGIRAMGWCRCPGPPRPRRRPRPSARSVRSPGRAGAAAPEPDDQSAITSRRRDEPREGQAGPVDRPLRVRSSCVASRRARGRSVVSSPTKWRISRISARSSRNRGSFRCLGRPSGTSIRRSMPPGTRRHDHDPVAHVDGFVDVVRDEEHRGPPRLPDAQDFVLHAHPGELVEGAERLVQEQDLRMIDQRPGEGRPLGHAAGELMRVGVGEGLRAPRGAGIRRPRRDAGEAPRGPPGRTRCCGGRSSTGRGSGPGT